MAGEMELSTSMLGGFLDSTQGFVLIIAGFFIFIMVGILFVYWFVNRSSAFAMKIDLKGRNYGGLIKRMPNRAILIIQRGQGYSIQNDKWGTFEINGEKKAVTKFTNITFPAPRHEHVFVGNVLLITVPNFGEAYATYLDKETQELKAQVEYDMVGHVYGQIRVVHDKFARKSTLEAIAPYIALAGVVFAGLAIVFIVAKMGYDQMAVVAQGLQGTAAALQETARALGSNMTAGNPPPV